MVGYGAVLMNNLTRILVAAILFCLPVASLPLLGIMSMRGTAWCDVLPLLLILGLIELNIALGAIMGILRDRRMKPSLIDWVRSLSWAEEVGS